MISTQSLMNAYLEIIMAEPCLHEYHKGPEKIKAVFDREQFKKRLMD